MAPDDIDRRVIGAVIVDIRFDESGSVEKVIIVRSTKESLAEVVTAAVSRWQIAPLTRGGIPSKVVVRQTFTFKAEW